MRLSEPAPVHNNLDLFLFDEIQVRVEHLVRLDAGDLFNLGSEFYINRNNTAADHIWKITIYPQLSPKNCKICTLPNFVQFSGLSEMYKGLKTVQNPDACLL